MEEVKKDKKVLYHFVIFAIINELLIIKNYRISPACLMQARDEMRKIEKCFECKCVGVHACHHMNINSTAYKSDYSINFFSK